MHLDVLYLGQHRHCDRGGVNTSRRFGHGHPLHSMYARLILERPERAAPLDLEDDLFDAAQRRLGGREDFGLEAQTLCVAHDHPLHLGAKEGGFVATGTGAHLHDDVLVIPRILLEHREAYLLFQLLKLLARAISLRDNELLHVGVEPTLAQHGLGFEQERRAPL